MENYPITISLDKKIHHFEIGEYLHHRNETCKVKVFQEGKLVASFEPDAYNYLHVCQNPGNLGEELLYLLADQIEAHHPHGINKQSEPETVRGSGFTYDEAEEATDESEPIGQVDDQDIVELPDLGKPDRP